MGRKKLSEQAKQEFRDALLAAALKLFAESGYESVSIRALSKAVGCSAMTPYRYFEHKAAIFDACRCRAFEDFAEAQELVAARHRDPLQRIRALGEAYAAFVDNHPAAFRLMFELDQQLEPGSELRKAERRAFRTLRDAVTEAVQRGRLRGDPITLAHLYWTSLHGIVVLSLTRKLVHGRTRSVLLGALFEGAFTRAASSA